MDQRDSHCPYLLSSETTAKGTGLAKSAGKEDPVELDSSVRGVRILVVRALRHDPLRGQLQAGSLTGAVHLSKGNAGVLRTAQRGQKPRVEQKGKCCLDPDFQYEYGPRKRGLSILLPY